MPSKVSQFQKFTMERIERSAIKGAPWNPRKLSDAAKRKISKGLKEIGLLGPVIVNKRTMQLVGGHQRLACLDALEGKGSYSLDVAMVALSEKRAKEAALLLNNADAMGEWDLKALHDMLPDLDIGLAGFDQVGLDLLFDGSEFSSLFGKKSQTPGTQAAVEALEAISSLSDDTEAPDDAETVKRKASADAVAEMRKTSKGMSVKEDTERYAVVIFNTRPERQAFMERLGLDPAGRYVTAAQLAPHLAQSTGKRSRH